MSKELIAQHLNEAANVLNKVIESPEFFFNLLQMPVICSCLHLKRVGK